MEISAQPRVGGVGVDLLKDHTKTSAKKFLQHNLWTTNTDTGRVALPLLFLAVVSGGVAFAFGYRSQNIGARLDYVVNTYRVVSDGYFDQDLTSLMAFNYVDTTNDLAKCLIWGTVINGLGLLLNCYFATAGIGKRSQKMLHLFLVFGFANAATYLALGVICITLGVMMHQNQSLFDAACDRIISEVGNAFCHRDTEDVFNNLNIDTMGGGIPLLFSGTALLVSVFLLCHSVGIMRAHPTIDLSPPPGVVVANVPSSMFTPPPLRTDQQNPHRQWLEVGGMSHTQQGVGQASLVVPVPYSEPDPVNVGPALTSLSHYPPRDTGAPDVLLGAMQSHMERLGETQYAQQYRQAQQQMQQGF